MIHFGHVAQVNLLECNESGQLVLKLSDFAALEDYFDPPERILCPIKKANGFLKREISGVKEQQM